MNEQEYDAEFRNKIDKFPISEQVKMADDALSNLKVYLYLFLATMERLSYAEEVLTDEERKTFAELEKEYADEITAVIIRRRRKRLRP